jgi:uncharacterized protein
MACKRPFMLCSAVPGPHSNRGPQFQPKAAFERMRPSKSHSSMTRVVYLHGFASSPSSRKATFFREKLQPLGIELETPQLEQGDFRNLTLSKQLRAIESALGGAPVRIVGSSMGGYLAALYAASHPEVEKLVLLAPAFNFYLRWVESLGNEKMQQWQAQGEIPVYHYAEGREVPIGYQLIEDAKRYEAFPRFSQPSLIFHGTQDAVVPVLYSEQVARSHPNVKLVTLNSGHELTDVLGTIWEESKSFLLQAIAE